MKSLPRTEAVIISQIRARRFRALRAVLSHLRPGWWLVGTDSRAPQLANKGCSHVGRGITQNPKIKVFWVPGFRFLN